MPGGGAVHRERPRVFAAVARERPADGDRVNLLCHDRGRHRRDQQRQNGGPSSSGARKCREAWHEPGDFGSLSFHFFVLCFWLVATVLKLVIQISGASLWFVISRPFSND